MVSKTKDKARKHVCVCEHLHTEIADMSTFEKTSAPEGEKIRTGPKQKAHSAYSSYCL